MSCKNTSFPPHRMRRQRLPSGRHQLCETLVHQTIWWSFVQLLAIFNLIYRSSGCSVQFGYKSEQFAISQLMSPTIIIVPVRLHVSLVKLQHDRFSVTKSSVKNVYIVFELTNIVCAYNYLMINRINLLSHFQLKIFIGTIYFVLCKLYENVNVFFILYFF